MQRLIHCWKIFQNYNTWNILIVGSAKLEALHALHASCLSILSCSTSLLSLYMLLAFAYPLVPCTSCPRTFTCPIALHALHVPKSFPTIFPCVLQVRYRYDLCGKVLFIIIIILFDIINRITWSFKLRW